MAMTMGFARDGEPVAEINTTPLIDVMLVLLVMLIITLPQQNHALNLDTPVPCETCAPPENPVPPINVVVETDGGIWWNGEVVSRGELQKRFASEVKKAAQAELHIQVNRFAKYGSVAHVLAAAQRVGIRRMGIVGMG